MSFPLPETCKILYASTNQGGQPTIEEVPLPKPGNNQILVKMEFAPINPSDLGVMQGSFKYINQTPHPIGLEGSGTVVALGQNLILSHKIGDRVHVCGYGTMGQYLLADSDQCSPIHNGLPFEEAASHLVNPGTVYYMGLKAQQGGHKAAIHTVGASALGKMLIRYFKHIGIKLINIVRKDEQIEELKKEGADYVLNSQAPDFEAQLKEIAEKEKATIAFDAICGEFTSKVLRNQPRKSIIYVYGMLAGPDVLGLDLKDLVEGRSVSVLFLFDLTGKLRAKGELPKFYNEVHALLPTIFKTDIQKVFKLNEIQEAVAYYQANSSKGKVLIKSN